jgi:hypothetical protein
MRVPAGKGALSERQLAERVDSGITAHRPIHAMKSWERAFDLDQ